FRLFGGTDPRAASTLFREAIHVDAAAAGLGLGVLVASVLILALRDGHQLRLLPLALPCAVLGTSLVSAALHAQTIMAVGTLPFYGMTGQTQMHVGRERDVPVTLMRPSYRHWFWGTESGPQPADEATRSAWTHVERVHVRALSAGSLPFTAEARRGPVTLSTKLAAQAVPEIASPLFSLRVGDRSVYRVRARSSQGALLFFITIAGSESIHEVTVEVVGTRIRDGFRTFVVAVTREGRLEEVEVVAISGETRVYDAEKGTIGTPIVAFAGESSGPDPVPCTFALLDAGHALCQRGGRAADVPAAASMTHGDDGSRARASRGSDRLGRPPVAFAGAAPLTFERNTSSTGGGFATAFVAILTIGLVILPDGSTSSSYTLVGTQRGAEGAPEALPN
ncbi:MAG TPA: hypothetical protein VLT33_13365, partial [Labilithrix sp.]|nr:hypothetical protein [Labilithrix sp.]